MGRSFIGHKIILEDKSRDTFENALYTKEICIRSGFKNSMLITSASHMSRAVLSFKKVGMDVMPFPANFKTGSNKKIYMGGLPARSIGI